MGDMGDDLVVPVVVVVKSTRERSSFDLLKTCSLCLDHRLTDWWLILPNVLDFPKRSIVILHVEFDHGWTAVRPANEHMATKRG
jgi:hypothetical protein